jgi:hypothetical protein
MKELNWGCFTGENGLGGVDRAKGVGLRGLLQLDWKVGAEREIVHHYRLYIIVSVLPHNDTGFTL